MQYTKYHFPFHFYNNEDLYKKLNPCEKAIYDIDFFSKRTSKFKEKFSSDQSKNILTIPFEQFVLNPNEPDPGVPLY